MEAQNRRTDLRFITLLSIASKSKEEFIREYEKYEVESAKELYFNILSNSFHSIINVSLHHGRFYMHIIFVEILSNLKNAVIDGNIDILSKISNLMECTNSVNNFINDKDPIICIELIILACKYNKVQVIEYLFSNNNVILKHLSVSIEHTKSLFLTYKNDEFHDAFYYAILSNNVHLFDTLTGNLECGFFTFNSIELDEIISRSYEELQLQNVWLSDGMKYFIEKKLINLRFFSNSFVKNQCYIGNANYIKQRIESLLQNIYQLKEEYPSMKEVDEKFLYVTKYIAQNIYTLKRQLKSTYSMIPWEEIEFCLICFVDSHLKKSEINLFYCSVLNKSRIFKHLDSLTKIIEANKHIMLDISIDKMIVLPKLTREKVVSEIVNNYPQFKELYYDYQQIRDIYSLEKINYYIRLALSCNPKERDGQLAIVRALQVIGEFLKNTLESPKLSNATNDLLLLSLPKNTRKIIISLRNSISHVHSLSKRTEIEENNDLCFFVGIQNDTKKVGAVINEILFDKKIKIVMKMLKQITVSENNAEVVEVVKILNFVNLDELMQSENFEIMEQSKLKTLIQELSDSIIDKTEHEKELINKISKIIKSSNTQTEKMETNYFEILALLKGISNFLKDNIDRNVIEVIKFRIDKTLKKIAPTIETYHLEEIALLSMKFYNSVNSRVHYDNRDEVIRLVCEIVFITEFGTVDIKYIEELRGKLNGKDHFIPINTEIKATKKITSDIFNNQLTLKINELKYILGNILSNEKTNEIYSSYKKERKNIATVEIMVLDILSILGSYRNNLVNNLHCFDDYAPVLNGKFLRNHLAHHNAIIDILSSDPSISILLNAKQLTEENLFKKNIGKFVEDNPSKFKNKFAQGLLTIANKEKMFVSIEGGCLESFKYYLKKGTDINARNINSWTTLHFAARGSNIKIIKFILEHNITLKVKDINGQSPLHVAAAYGRTDNVEFFLEQKDVFIDDPDIYGKTPLHIAAKNGHKDTVFILLKYHSSTTNKDVLGLSPLHYAIRNNHLDISKIILARDVNTNINESMGGFTPLHEAAECGQLELVEFLLQNEAQINTKNDRDWTALHAAALNGHLEIVRALIIKGADINATVINGCTPLHYATETGRDKIATILLKHGANANAAEKVCNVTPLHYAAKYGHTGIVKTLLKNRANPSALTIENITPLHSAVNSGNLEIVITLINVGVNINAEDKNKLTPLHLAVANGFREIVELLITNLAKINSKSKDKITPLHVAALKGNKILADLLIKHKAFIDAQDTNGNTPLHTAAFNGSLEVTNILIKHKAEINIRNNKGMTPLHAATVNGFLDVFLILLKNKADINASDNYGNTPFYLAVGNGYKDIVQHIINIKSIRYAKDVTSLLYLAIQTGDVDIVKILFENVSFMDISNSNPTPLYYAIKCNKIEIVEFLIANGADVNEREGKPLSLAVLFGYRDIVNILLKNKARINIKGPGDATPLHLAAKMGFREITIALIIRGAEIDALAVNNITPLFIAVEEGHAYIVEILISNNANVNFIHAEGTPLHIASGRGHDYIVKVLLTNGANIFFKDSKNRTPIELAIVRGHLDVVKVFLQHKKIDMNIKGNDDWTMLHIASQQGNLDMVEYLIEEGSDIHAKNSSGSKAIHIAAREGHKDIVKLFLGKGFSVNDKGAANQTLLHYASIKGQLQISKYLIDQGADFNAQDINGSSPLHIAAQFGHQNVIQYLIENGAVYNEVDKLNRKPIQMSERKNITNIFASIENLFKALKHNNVTEVESILKTGAFVNAVNNKNETLLHYAAWKGCDKIVTILLKNGANCKTISNNGLTALHYAAKFSHFKVITILMSYGAVYNAITKNGKSPADLSTNKCIRDFFELVNDSFINIKNDNSKVINELNNLSNLSMIKAIMSTRNRENETLIVAGVHSNFTKLNKLKRVAQGDLHSQINVGLVHFNQGNYEQALNIFTCAHEKRADILGTSNPGTLDILSLIARVLYAQGSYQESFNILEEIYQKQKYMLGIHQKDTLRTRCSIALILHRQGKNEESYNIYKNVCEKQKEILGPNHSETIDTELHIALVLDGLEKYKEALIINREIFNKMKHISGANAPITISAQNNIAMVLVNRGEFSEALEIYKEVLEKKKVIFGNNHSVTLRTLHNIALILLEQKKYYQALQALMEVLSIQKNVLGLNHPDTLNTQYNIANVLFAQGKWIGALKAYKECFHRSKAVFGTSHPAVLDILKKLKIINHIFNIEGSKESDIIKYLQNEINIAAANGDVQRVQRLLKTGTDVNIKDIDGISPLLYAISHGHMNIVNLLLITGADITQATNKGNTPLHIATSKGSKEMVEVLLKHTDRDKLNDIINAKTAAKGTTPLHVAAMNGHEEIVKCLLKNGAIYNIQNKESITPHDISKNIHIKNLLELADELFEDAKEGNIDIIRKLKTLQNDEFVAITNARNHQGNTLLQVAIVIKSKIITFELLDILKTIP